MDMMSMGGGMEFSPLYAQAKEILAAGMLAELAEDAKEAIGGEGEGEGECPHCGSKMGMGNPMATPRLSQMGGEMEAEDEYAPMLPPQLAMRMPAPSMPPMPGRQAPMTPLQNLGM